MPEITVRLPKHVVLDILKQIPKEELDEILPTLGKRNLKSLPAKDLLKLAGIVSIGGDALEDTERIWLTGD